MQYSEKCRFPESPSEKSPFYFKFLVAPEPVAEVIPEPVVEVEPVKEVEVVEEPVEVVKEEIKEVVEQIEQVEIKETRAPTPPQPAKGKPEMNFICRITSKLLRQNSFYKC